MVAGRFHELGPFDAPGFPPSRLIRAYVPERSPDAPPRETLFRGRSLSETSDRSAGRPVLFLFDGQNVFEDEPSFAGGWHAHKVVDRLARSRRPVVVGIPHGGERRMAELSPFPVSGSS